MPYGKLVSAPGSPLNPAQQSEGGEISPVLSQRRANVDEYVGAVASKSRAKPRVRFSPDVDYREVHFPSETETSGAGDYREELVGQKRVNDLPVRELNAESRRVKAENSKVDDGLVIALAEIKKMKLADDQLEELLDHVAEHYDLFDRPVNPPLSRKEMVEATKAFMAKAKEAFYEGLSPSLKVALGPLKDVPKAVFDYAILTNRLAQLSGDDES